MALNSFAQQETVNPEAVQPRFLNDDDWEGFSGPRARFPPELRKARQQRSDIPARHAVLGHLLPAAWRQRCGQPGRSAQFQRDKYRAKIGPGRGRCRGLISYVLHGRLQSGWWRPHAPKSPVATTASWDLEKDDVQADPTAISGKADTAE